MARSYIRFDLNQHFKRAWRPAHTTLSIRYHSACPSCAPSMAVAPLPAPLSPTPDTPCKEGQIAHRHEQPLKQEPNALYIKNIFLEKYLREEPKFSLMFIFVKI